MPVPCYAWWRGRGLTWRRPETLAADVAGLCRATDLGTAVPRLDPWRSRAMYNLRRGPRARAVAVLRVAQQGWPPHSPLPAPARRRARRLPRPRPPTPARPRQQASRVRTPARLPLRPEPPVTHDGCPTPAPPGPVLRAATRYSTNIVSTINKVSKIIKVR